MFYGCYSLNKLNLSNFNTKSVKNMKSVFMNCYSLKEINLFKYNTENVNIMSYMFYNCKSLKNLYISKFKFSKCLSIEMLDLSSFKPII